MNAMYLLCTLYSHHFGLEGFENQLKEQFPKAKVQKTKEDNLDVLQVQVKRGLFKSPLTFKVSYRQRNLPSYTLKRADCDYSRNLLGLMYNHVTQIPGGFGNKELRRSILDKFKTVNAEYNFVAEAAPEKELNEFIRQIGNKLNALVIMLEDSPMLTVPGVPVLFNHNFQKVLDFKGNEGSGELNLAILPEFETIKKEDEERERIRLQNVEEWFKENAPAESYERKIKNEKRLSDFGIPYNTSLPVIEVEAEVKLRTLEEVVNRLLALELVVMVADGASRTEMRSKYADYLPFLSQVERNFVMGEHDEDMANQMMFRLTAIDVLHWLLGLVHELEMPYMVGTQLEFLIDRHSREQIIEESELRPVSEILDEADLAYRTHWVSEEARINGYQSPHVTGDVTYERLYTFNWLIGAEDWDDVRTDT